MRLGHVLGILSAQPTNSLLQDVVLPPPNAAALGKYTDVPISHFTGVPSINIPIYTVQEGPLSLPISLNYHASGLKVAETSSWVGMGWSLNAGGMITRTVLGIADELTLGYASIGEEVTDQISDVKNQIETVGYTIDNTILPDVVSGLKDNRPDIFSFNFSGFSGKFYLDATGEVYLIPRQDVRIEIDWGGNKIQGFIITSPQGVKYYFGNLPGESDDKGIETSLPFAFNPDNPDQETTNSWYLLKIESPDSKFFIELTYEEEYYSYIYPASCTYDWVTCAQVQGSNQGLLFFDPSPSGSAGGGSSGKNCSGQVYIQPNKSYIRNNINGKRIKTITTSSNNVLIEFKKGEVREDLDVSNINQLNTASSLNSIEILQNSACMRWNFSYTYSQPFPSYSFNNRTESKRLILTEVQQEACSNSQQNFIPPYKFFTKETLMVLTNYLIDLVGPSTTGAFIMGQLVMNSQTPITSISPKPLRLLILR